MAENITPAKIGDDAYRSVRQMELVRLTGHAATQATGTVTFDDNPTDGDTLTLNGVEFTFLDTAVDPETDVEIGADAEETMANLLALLTASVDVLLTVATYAASGSVLTITFTAAGTGGNAYTLATDGDDISLSDETLTGGTAATAAGDTSTAYVSGIQKPTFCVGAATVVITGQSVVFTSLTALGGDACVVRLYQ